MRNGNKPFSSQNPSENPCDLIRQVRDRMLPLLGANIAYLLPRMCTKNFLAEPKV